MVSTRQIRCFSRLLETDGVAMPDTLWQLAYAAYIDLLSMNQKAFWQSAALQAVVAKELKAFWDAYLQWRVV